MSQTSDPSSGRPGRMVVESGTTKHGNSDPEEVLKEQNRNLRISITEYLTFHSNYSGKRNVKFHSIDWKRQVSLRDTLEVPKAVMRLFPVLDITHKRHFITHRRNFSTVIPAWFVGKSTTFMNLL